VTRLLGLPLIAELEPILQPGAQNRWDVWVTGFGDFVNVDAERGGEGGVGKRSRQGAPARV